MTLGIGIFNGITGTGNAGSQLPAQQDIVAKYQNTVSSDNNQWIDTNASGNYEVEKGVSLSFSAAQEGTAPYADIINKTIIVYAVLDSASTGDFATFLSFGAVVILAKDAVNNFLLGGPTPTGISALPYMDQAHKYSIVTDNSGSTINFLIDDISIWTGAGAVTPPMNLSIGSTFIGEMWDLTVTDNSTGQCTFSNFLAQGDTSATCYSEVGPDVTLVGFTLPTDYEENLEFGHEWSNYSVVGSGKVPQDPSNLGFDIFGDPLTNPGTPQKNISVQGYTGAWDGLTSGTFQNPTVDVSGDFKMVFTGVSTLDTSAVRSLLYAVVDALGGVRVEIGGALRVYIGGSNKTFGTLVLSVGTVYTLTLERISGVLTATLDDGITPVSELWLGAGNSDLNLTTLGSKGASLYWSGTITSLSIEQSGSLTNHWIVESSSTSLQDSIYDIIGGNHATLTGATLPFFITLFDGSKLFADGFEDVGGSTGLVPAGANTGSLTNQPVEFSGTYALFYAPLSVSFYDMSVIAGIDSNLYLAGDAIGLTADAWIALANNPLFFGATQNTLVAYNAVQSGDTLTKINDYLS